MISAGNDVVALAAINITRTNQYNFYSKILSESENPLYNEFDLTGIPFENFIWLLWSIKESAYKYLQRHNSGLIFTPVKFVVSDLHLDEGYSSRRFYASALEGIGFKGMPCIKAVITFAGRTLYSCSLLFDELIHTVVSSNDEFENVCWGVKKIDSDDSERQSAEVRAFLLEQLKKLYADSDFTVDKNASGCPVLIRGTTEVDMPVSLSHHGCFVGYSFDTSIVLGNRF